MTGIVDTTHRGLRRVFQAVLFSLTSSLLACGAQPQVQRPSPGNTPTPQVQPEVLVMPMGQKTSEELPYWTSQNQRLVLAYFDIFLRHGFYQKTNSDVVVTEDDFQSDSLEFVFEDVDEGNGQAWWSFIPSSGRVEHDGRYPDYVLIFDGLRFRILGGGGARQTYDAPGGGKVELNLEYVLWDNRNQEVVASGRLHEESATSSPHPSSELFKELFERMAEDVVKKGPLTG